MTNKWRRSARAWLELDYKKGRIGTMSAQDRVLFYRPRTDDRPLWDVLFRIWVVYRSEVILHVPIGAELFDVFLIHTVRVGQSFHEWKPTV